LNFYKHHIGDYDADTAHLSWLEDMAYTRLMRLYYRREVPIPSDIAQACRLVRASSKQEREAVESVLSEFFVLDDDGWHNKRCDEEIGEAQAKADKNRTVGKLGGRPRKKETIMVSGNNHDGSESEPNNNPSQTPDSRLQTPDIASASGGSTSDERAAEPTPAGIACRAMRQAGLADANPQHPKLLALLAAGITADELANAAADAAQRSKGFAYALATAEGRRRDAATVTPLPQGQPRRKSLGEERADTLDALTGRSRTRAIASAAERDITGEVSRVE
jgi:uncharacterized protein YdaU (DUF1376 family)